MAETDCIDEVIFTSGLSSSRTGMWNGIEFGWADYIYQGITLARYIFTFTDAAQWNMLYERQAEFMSEIIEPVYFQQASDISWNLYWVAVLTEEQLQRLDLQKRLTFSSNTEFTRNLVVSLEQLPNRIPVGRVSLSWPAGDLPQPADVWTDALNRDGFGFCLSEYKSAVLESYLETGLPPKDKKSLRRKREVQQSIQSIREVRIPQDFRPHYYPKDWNIPLVSANVLYGPNGTGKTSVLSAIEAVLTGETSCGGTQEQFEPDSGLELRLNTDQGELAVRPARDNAEKKQREQRWYLNRENNRTKRQLNEVFHRFNYFSSEEAFLFSTRHQDYRDIFTKILYGPNTDELWRNRSRYLEECKKYGVNLKSQMKMLQKEKNQLVQLPPYDRFALTVLLTSSGLAISSDLPLDKILETTQAVLTECEKVQDIHAVLSREQIERRLAEQRKAWTDEKTRRDDYREKYQQLQERHNQLQEEKTALEQQRKRLEEQNAALEALAPAKQQLAFSIQHQTELNAYHAARAEKTEVTRQLFDLELLLSDYGEVLKNPPDFSLEEAERRLNDLAFHLSNLKQQQHGLEEKIQQEELMANQRSKTMALLRSSGLEFYEWDSDLDTCPLCGTHGITKSVLLAHMEQDQTQQQTTLMDLNRELTQVRTSLAATEAEISSTKEREKQALVFDHASKEVLARYPSLTNIKDIFAFKDALQSRLDECTRLVSARKVELQRLYGAQFDVDELMPVEESRASLAAFLFSCGTEFRSDTSDGELLQMVLACQSDLNEEIDANRRALSAVQNDLQDDSSVFVCKQYWASSEQTSKIEENLSELEREKTFWEKVQFILKDPDLSAASLKSLCVNIRDTVKSIMAYEDYTERQSQYCKKIQEIGEKQERCAHLQRAIEELEPPTVYAEQFIRQNIQQVSQIFSSLHQPQEFSKLEIDPDKGLVGYRGKEAIPVSQMSTGQRTALVLSVFFQMNLTADYTPAFLLLDEPVANIDDLNILALIDFLREFVITHHRQIIVTTANQNVAKLFRRKFSFLSEDYQELSFYREQELQLRIIKRNYSQQQTVKNEVL